MARINDMMSGRKLCRLRNVHGVCIDRLQVDEAKMYQTDNDLDYT